MIYTEAVEPNPLIFPGIQNQRMLSFIIWNFSVSIPLSIARSRKDTFGVSLLSRYSFVYLQGVSVCYVSLACVKESLSTWP